MRPTPRRLPDEAAGPGAVEVMGLIAVVILAVVPALQLFHGLDAPEGGDALARDHLQRSLDDVVSAGEAWCCPEDPSAASAIQDAALQAWAGQPDRLEQNFTGWFQSPSATVLELSMGFVAANLSPSHAVDLYGQRTPTGPTVGTTRFTAPAPRGPGFLVPQLENATGAATATSTAFLPLSWDQPYLQGLQDRHATELSAHAWLTRDGHAAPDPLQVNRSAHQELSGAWRPAMELLFEEPDWTTTPVDLDDRDPRLVVTSEDLRLEDAAHGDGDPATPTQHPFQLQAALHGPGLVKTAPRGGSLTDGDPATVHDAYRITVHVPRNWTAVEVNTTDQASNDAAGWHNLTIEQDPAGAWTLTAWRHVETTYRNPVDAAHPGQAGYVLGASTSVDAPLAFHATPPSTPSTTQSGFQAIAAQLDLVDTATSQPATLLLELAGQGERVHRSLPTLLPGHVPATPSPGGSPTGIRLPVGTVLLAGDHDLTVHRVHWQAPAGSLLEDASSPAPIQDYHENETGTPGTWTIYHEGDAGRPAQLPAQGDLLVWEPPAPSTCPALQACALAAWVRMDGAPLPALPAHPASQLVVLYEREDVRSYTDWFHHQDWAYEGVNATRDPGPGFARAALATDPQPGPVPGSRLFALPPSERPLCNQLDVDTRNQPTVVGTGNTILYQLGPAEHGLPHLGDRPGQDGCPANPSDARTFHLVAQAGTTDPATPALSSVARASYTSPMGLAKADQMTWLEGVHDSRLNGTRQAPAGTTARLTLDQAPLLDALDHTDATQATLRVRVLDPYNAWEDIAWQNSVLARDLPLDHTAPALSCTLPATNPCATTTLPPQLTLDLPLPGATVPGTHLVVAELSWDVTGTAGQPLMQTARLFWPVDVLTPEGERARPATLEAVAWMEDWG